MLLRIYDLIINYKLCLRVATYYYVAVITHSLCVFVFGLNVMRVSGVQSESHDGEGEA